MQRSSNEVSCEDIAKDPKEACENYHFRCQACANDTILLQHSKAFTHVYYLCTHVNRSTLIIDDFDRTSVNQQQHKLPVLDI